ncbi:MAG: cytochrome ubiquinol oxidase subunit I [Cyanobacteria bacterium REEB67]|nr:cytochrome ubiquinol oxidase subunit I [Cyanobacteria bacterium REEB67]
MDALAWHRFQFAFTVTYHYLFPQLTMGLALIIVILKGLALKSASPNNKQYDDLARFWARIFAINFAVGVVTGIPLEFEFGTNWARFSKYSGGVIGTTLAMEGMFAFFAESSFLGLFLFGEKKLGPKLHFLSAVMVFLGSWLSGYFIIVTNAFMQHPVGYAIGPKGTLELADMAAYLLNPWAIWQYLHNMCAAVVTGSFVVTALAAYWNLMGLYQNHARKCLKVGVVVAFIATCLQLFPTGDGHGKMVAEYQKPALAAMEGKFESSSRAELALIGQPNVTERKLVNPIFVPAMLSYLAYGSFGATVQGLNDFPADQVPDNIELLYFGYHIMVGLGTLFILLTSAALIALSVGKLYTNKILLWLLMLAFPFPYIATTAGWMVTELGRQPWLIYGLQRTMHGTSPLVFAGNVTFSTLGFMGLYVIVGLLFLYLVFKEINKGPVYPPLLTTAEQLSQEA